MLDNFYSPVNSIAGIRAGSSMFSFPVRHFDADPLKIRMAGRRSKTQESGIAGEIIKIEGMIAVLKISL